MAVSAKEVEQEAAKIAAETTDTPTESSEDIIKSLVGVVDRLTKSGKFGNTDAAHNGNDADKSSPTGGGAPAEGYKSADAEEKLDGADGRISRSVSRSRASNAETPTTLNKGGEDDGEDKDDEDDDDDKYREGYKKSLRKSDGDGDEEPASRTLTEEKVYERIAKGEGAGADEYRQVVDASDAIQYLTDELVKAQVFISKQVDEARRELRKSIRAIRALTEENLATQAALAKSLAHIVREQDRLAKSEVKNPKSNGAVTVVEMAKASGNAGGKIDKVALTKSLAVFAATTADRDLANTAANVMANLDTYSDTGAYWASLPDTFRKAVEDAQAATA